MSIPKIIRQWDLYQANLGEKKDCWLLVLSSTETNQILADTVLACEIVPESIERLTPSPLNLPASPNDTGLDWPATISVMTLASIPRNCLISLEGRLEPVRRRASVIRGLAILLGTEPWP